MLVRHFSDIHNEFKINPNKPVHLSELKAFKITELPTDKDTLLILNGDIDSDVNRLGKLVNTLSKQFKHVIVVAGNHEAYSGLPVELWESALSNLLTDNNVYIAGCSPKVFIIDNYRFVCGTGWTDLTEPEQKVMAEYYMNDYNYGQQLNPSASPYSSTLYTNLRAETTSGFNQLLGDLMEATPKDGLVNVLVTHHVPDINIEKLVKGSYNKNTSLLPCYYSCKGKVIDNVPKFDHIFFGHIHNNSANLAVIYENTVCHVNCVGYPTQFLEHTCEAITI